jgi:hypothetical protein
LNYWRSLKLLASRVLRSHLSYISMLPVFFLKTSSLSGHQGISFPSSPIKIPDLCLSRCSNV